MAIELKKNMIIGCSVKSAGAVLSIPDDITEGLACDLVGMGKAVFLGEAVAPQEKGESIPAAPEPAPEPAEDLTGGDVVITPKPKATKPKPRGRKK